MLANVVLQPGAFVQWAPMGSPGLLGTLTGLLLVFAPDHLGTLLALTAGVKTATRAFVVGLAWGLGHSTGMLLACLLVILAKSAAPEVDLWENVGNYCAGLLMVSVGAYFIFREDQYLEQKLNGSYAVRPCCCCTQAEASADFLPENGPVMDARAGRQAKNHSKICTTSYGMGRARAAATDRAPPDSPSSPAAALHADVEDATECTSLMNTEEQDGTPGRSARGAVVGLVQAMLCPSCLMGLGPAYQMAATDSVGMHAAFIFLAAAAAASTLGVATLTATWSMLTTYGISKYVSPFAMYRGSCGFTIGIGVMWILLNACGMMSVMEYAEPHHVAAMLENTMRLRRHS